MNAPRELSSETRALLGVRHAHLIDGRDVDTGEGPATRSTDPATGDALAEIAAGGRQAVELAAASGERAFRKGEWRLRTPAEKARVLLKVAELIEAHAEVLAELETLEGGKLFGSTLSGEVPAAAECFRYYAGWCGKAGGYTFEPSVPGVPFLGYVRREPVGLTAAITAYNGPLVMAAWKLAPALVAGCSVVLKPPEQTSLSSLYLGRLLLEAGVPAGVVNVVTGRGSLVGQALAEHPSVAKISFTGSTAVGRRLVQTAGGDLKRLSLELGGKSPVLIFDDADLDAAIAGAAQAIFSNAGQVCVAGSRIYAQRGVYEAVRRGLAEAAGSLRLGSGLDPQATLGPLISQAHRASVDGFVAEAAAEGAELVCGGETPTGVGYFYPPTVLATAGANLRIVREEVFGPVVTVAPFDTPEEAIALANNSVYGLAASVWTRDLGRAHNVAAAVEAGIVWVNSHGIPELSMPIGGMKQSGWGREHGVEAIHAFTETKSVMVRL